MVTTMAESECITEIGATAGRVWKVLSSEGPMTFARLAKELDMPRDLVMQAVGWLAREGKVEIEAGPRGRTVSLR